MVSYSCFQCGKEVTAEMLGRRIRCPFCSSKILYKTRTTGKKVKAV